MEIAKVSGATASGASVSGATDWIAIGGYYSTSSMELQFNTTLGDGLPQLSIRIGGLAGSPVWPNVIDWGDGTVEELIVTPQTHIYSTGGVYDVKLNGFGVFNPQDDIPTKLVQINKWSDTIELLSLNGCQQLTSITDSNSPVFSSGSGVLLLANCPLLSAVSGINNWDVSELSSLSSAFFNSSLFDEDISSWDVSGITQFGFMFQGSTSFNQDISGWDVSSGSQFSSMFYNASSFDQNLGPWKLGNNALADFFFANAGISDSNVALCLEGWDSVGQGTGVNMSNMFGTAVIGGGPRTLSESTYPNAKTAYDNLISTYSWTLSNSINWVP
jgi:surface protein